MSLNDMLSGNVKGLAIGVVKDIKDPDKLNRVKVNIPDCQMDIPCVPVIQSIASNGYGSVIMPQVGDIVVVGFIYGRIENGIVLGCIYHGKNKPPLAVNDKNNIIQLKTKNNTLLELDDTENKQKITLKTKKGLTVEIDEEKETILLSDKDKKNSVKLDAKGGSLQLTGEKKVVIKGGNDSIKIEDGKGFSFSTSGGDFKADCNNFQSKAKANVKLEGNANVELKGNAKVAIESSGQAAFKGSITQIG